MLPNHIIQEILEHGLFNEIGELSNHVNLSDLTQEIVNKTFAWIYFREYGFFEVEGAGATHHYLVACYNMMKNKHMFVFTEEEKTDILFSYNNGDLSDAFSLLRSCYGDIEDYFAIVKYPVCYKSRAGAPDLIIGASSNFNPIELSNFESFEFEYDT